MTKKKNRRTEAERWAQKFSSSQRQAIKKREYQADWNHCAFVGRENIFLSLCSVITDCHFIQVCVHVAVAVSVYPCRFMWKQSARLQFQQNKNERKKEKKEKKNN